MKSFLKRLIPNFIIRRQLTTQAGNCILLTFDDGPHPQITPKVLDLLHNHNARAIFFVVGHRAEKHPELLNEIIARGHVIGNHTFSHPNDRTPRYHEYRRDIVRCQQLILNGTGFTPQFFRPLRGEITFGGLLAARSVGLTSLFWASEGSEWGRNKNAGPEEITQALLSQIRPRHIVLLHDDHPDMPGILQEILPKLKERGLDLNKGIEYLKFARRYADKSDRR